MCRHSVFVSETSVKGEGLIRTVNANPRFEIFSDSLLGEVRLTLETDRLHPFRRVPNFVVMVAPKAEKESVGAEFDVVAHHCRVHPYQIEGEGANYEFHFDLDRAAYDLNDARLQEFINQL